MVDKLASKAGRVRLGDLDVSRLGLGTNRITDSPESYKLLKQAVDWGVDFIDTAHRYGSGASEIGIGNALAPYPENLMITTKGGFDYSGPDGSPAGLRAHLEESLQRLKTDCIYLYQLHRVDPNVPLEESVGALKAFQAEGKIRHIGLSEVDVDQLRRAQQIAPVVSVQNEYNVVVRKHEELVDYCSENGIVFMPWFPLGGLEDDFPRVEALLRELATKYEVSSQQLALAWLLKRSPLMLPIPGTLSVDHLKANLESANIELSDADYHILTDNKL